MHQAGHQLIIRIMKSYTQFLGVLLLLVVLVLEVGLAHDSPSTIVTPDFFNSLLQTPDWCEGKGFYTYDAFISAATDKRYRRFGTTGRTIVRRREMAAFLANVMHETGSFCYIRERNTQKNYCTYDQQYPCVRGKKYFGRGPLQLSGTWMHARRNSNYGAAGKAIGFDGLNNPEIVGLNRTISFMTAVWFWMSHSNCHQGITTGGGFGSTIRAINGAKECITEGNPAVQSRVNFYLRFCHQFGVHPGKNLKCFPMTLP